MSSCSLNGRLPQAGKYSERLLVMVGSCIGRLTLGALTGKNLWLARVQASKKKKKKQAVKRSELYLLVLGNTTYGPWQCPSCVHDVPAIIVGSNETSKQAAREHVQSVIAGHREGIDPTPLKSNA